MGTYTTNYQLYTPTVGETGWGTLVNGNFTTIDSTMKGLSNRITAVENEVNGNLSCTSVTASGKITGNGGIAGTTGTFSGAVTGTKITQTGVDTCTAKTTYNDSDYSMQTIIRTVVSKGEGQVLCVLPPAKHKYSGTFKLYIYPTAKGTACYWTTLGGVGTVITLTNYLGSIYTISFNNVQCLYIEVFDGMELCELTLS